MRGLIGVGALALAGTMLAGDSQAVTVSQAAIDMLDPTRTALEICGARRGADPLPARLQLAAALQQGASTAAGPELLDVSPAISLPVTSNNPLVARYVRQGLYLAYGFNHGAAIDSFRQAQRLDPECAICFWGEAFALGPNINAPMSPDAHGLAVKAAQRALALSGPASPVEKALIEALARRYSADDKADRAALDAAYADSMLAAAKKFPGEDDIALIAAEAVMDTRPWDYWEADQRTPKGQIGEAIQLVESVLWRSPDHPQASHLYIHLIENYSYPGRAEAAADRLARSGTPGAGHLVHMPAHIYYRLGRFKDSIDANVTAARADEAYLASAGENPTYRFGYYPHNVHFILASAQMAGDMDVVIDQAQRLSRVVNPEVAKQLGWLQPVMAAPYLAHAQFAAPDQILALGPPTGDLPYVVAMRHYARAVARAQQKDAREFARELAAIRAIREGPALKPLIDGGVPAADLLTIAEEVAQGRFAFAQGKLDEAITHYRRAAEIEQKVPYMEPPYWYYPVRQSLGAALYAAGRYDEARDAFMGALTQAPGNGWALYGLAETQRRLGHTVEAAAADAALKRAWLGDAQWLRMERL